MSKDTKSILSLHVLNNLNISTLENPYSVVYLREQPPNTLERQNVYIQPQTI